MATTTDADIEQSSHERVALINGGSRGIGAATVRRLAADGTDVAFTYLTSADAAETLAAEYSDEEVTVESIRADAGNLDEMTDLVERVVDRFGRLDVLVNSAGMTPMGSIEDVTNEDFEQTIDVNVRAPFMLARAAAGVMDKGGRIVNIGSVWGEQVQLANISLYTLSKFAVTGLTRALARDLGPKGITVNCVQPGPIDTDMNPADGEMAPVLVPMTALERYGEATEVADLIAFLAGPESSYVTGAVLNADGGMNA